MIYSFFGTYKANCVNPQQVLADILLKINDTKIAALNNLLPANWKLTGKYNIFCNFIGCDVIYHMLIENGLNYQTFMYHASRIKKKESEFTKHKTFIRIEVSYASD